MIFFSTLEFVPRKQSISNEVPKFDPMPTSITQHAIEALAGQGNVVTKDIDVTATIFGVFDGKLASVSLGRGLECQMDLRMQN